MITPEQEIRLTALMAWVGKFDRTGKTRRQFWSAFEEQEGDLGKLAFAGGADTVLAERYTDILAMADDMGYAGPDEIMDEVME